MEKLIHCCCISCTHRNGDKPALCDEDYAFSECPNYESVTLEDILLDVPEVLDCWISYD